MNLPENRLMVRKSNELVNARYSFSIWENRLFLKMLTLIRPEDVDFQKYRISMKDFIREFGIKNKDAYREVEQTTDSLLRKIVRIPGQKNGKDYVFKASLVASFEYFKDGSGFIEASFHPDLKPYLLQLKSQFLSYDIRNVARLSSAHSLRMYELLKQYEKIGTRAFALGELKELLGVAESYDRYFNFKTRVLLQAQKDLAKHTDIVFDFRELRQGRNVDSLRFEVRPNPARAPQPVAAMGELAPETLTLLSRYGIKPDATLTEILVNQPFDSIKKVCEKADKIFAQKRRTGNPVANESGYLLKLLHNPASFQAVNTHKTAPKSVYEREKERKDALRKRFDDELAQKTTALKEKYLTETLENEWMESQKNNLFFDKMKK